MFIENHRRNVSLIETLQYLLSFLAGLHIAGILLLLCTGITTLQPAWIDIPVAQTVKRFHYLALRHRDTVLHQQAGHLRSHAVHHAHRSVQSRKTIDHSYFQHLECIVAASHTEIASHIVHKPNRVHKLRILFRLCKVTNLLIIRILTAWINCRPESLQLLTHSIKDGSVAIYTVG